VEPRSVPGAEKPCLGFTTLTLVPYDRKLIDLSLITVAERGAIDAYHRLVRNALSPLLAGDDLAWLIRATAPL
jgi:Xaa-Pro aminopeptidase